MLEYFDLYKHLDNFNRKKDQRKFLRNTKAAPIRHMLNKSAKLTSVPLLPRKLNLVKLKGKAEVINLKFTCNSSF